METLASIYYIVTSIIIITLLIFTAIYSQNKKTRWYYDLLIVSSFLVFIITLFIGIESLSDINKKDSDSYLYQQGYKDGINANFEQRIDTVYIKKK